MIFLSVHDRTINGQVYSPGYFAMYEAMPNLQILNCLYCFLTGVSLGAGGVTAGGHCFLSLICGEINFRLANIRMYCFLLEALSKFVLSRDLSQNSSGSQCARSKN